VNVTTSTPSEPTTPPTARNPAPSTAERCGPHFVVTAPLKRDGANMPTMCHWIMSAVADNECPACSLPIGPIAISRIITTDAVPSNTNAALKSLVAIAVRIGTGSTVDAALAPPGGTRSTRRMTAAASTATSR
jgi:hypothetical protein